MSTTQPKTTAPLQRLVCIYPIGLPEWLSAESREYLSDVFRRSGIELQSPYTPPPSSDGPASSPTFLERTRRMIRRLEPDIRLLSVFPLLDDLDAFEFLIDAIAVFGRDHADDAKQNASLVHFSSDETNGRHILLVDEEKINQLYLLISQFGGLRNGALGAGGILLTKIGRCFTISSQPRSDTERDGVVELLKRFLHSKTWVSESAVRRRTDVGSQTQDEFSKDEPPTRPTHRARTASIPPSEPAPSSRPRPRPDDEGPTIEIHEERFVRTASEILAVATPDHYPPHVAKPPVPLGSKPLLPGQHHAVRVSDLPKESHTTVPAQTVVYNVPPPADPPTIKMKRVDSPSEPPATSSRPPDAEGATTIIKRSPTPQMPPPLSKRPLPAPSQGPPPRSGSKKVP